MDDILVSEMHNSIHCGAPVFLHLDSQVWNWFNDSQGHGKLDSDCLWYLRHYKSSSAAVHSFVST